MGRPKYSLHWRINKDIEYSPVIRTNYFLGTNKKHINYERHEELCSLWLATGTHNLF